MKKHIVCSIFLVLTIVLSLFITSCGELGGKASFSSKIELSGTRTYEFGETAVFEIVLDGNTFTSDLKKGDIVNKWISPAINDDNLQFVIDSISSDRKSAVIRLSGKPINVVPKTKLAVQIPSDVLENKDATVLIVDTKDSSIEISGIDLLIEAPDILIEGNRGEEIEPFTFEIKVKSGARFATLDIEKETQKVNVWGFFKPSIDGLSYRVVESIPEGGSDTMKIEVSGIPNYSTEDEENFNLVIYSNYLIGSNANIGVKGGKYKTKINRPETTASVEEETKEIDTFLTSDISETVQINLKSGQFNKKFKASDVSSWFKNEYGATDRVVGLTYTLTSLDNKERSALITIAGTPIKLSGKTYPYKQDILITIPKEAILDQETDVIVDTKDSFMMVYDAPLSSAVLADKLDIHAATNVTNVNITGIIDLSSAYFKDVAVSDNITSWITDEEGKECKDIGLTMSVVDITRDEDNESAKLSFKLSGTPSEDFTDEKLYITIPNTNYEPSRGTSSNLKPLSVDTLGSIYDIRTVIATTTSDKQEIFGGIGVDLQKDYAKNDKQKYTINIALQNATFTSDIAVGTKVESWFKKADGSSYTVPGLDYKISLISNQITPSVSAQATIELSGQPTSKSSEKIALVIPKSAINYNLGDFKVSDKVEGEASVYNIIEAPTLEISESTIASFVGEDIVNGSFTIKVNGSTFDEANIDKVTKGAFDSWIKPVSGIGGKIDGLSYSYSAINAAKDTITVKVEGKSSTKLEDVPFTVEVPQSLFSDKFAALSPIESKAKYSITERPSASALDSVTIYGAKDGESVSATIYIDLKEATLNSGSINATSWFENMPNGLSAEATTVASGVNAGKIQIEVSGKPTVISSDAINIIIPNNVYTYTNANLSASEYQRKAITVDTKNSVYDIKEVTATVSLESGNEITAVVGTSVEYTLTVVLTNAEFASSLAVSSDVSSWFVSSLNTQDVSNNDKEATNLTYTISEKTNSTTIKVRVSGVAMDVFSIFPLKNKALKVVIPSSAIKGNLKTITADSGSIVYNFYKQPTSSIQFTSYLYGYVNKPFYEQTLVISITTDIPLTLSEGTDAASFFSTSSLSNLSYTVSKVQQDTTNEYTVSIKVTQKGTDYIKVANNSLLKISFPASAFKDGLATTEVDVNKSAYKIEEYPKATVALSKGESATSANLVYRARVNGTAIEDVTGNTDVIYVNIKGAKFKGLSKGDNVSSWFKKADDLNTSSVISGISYTIDEVDANGSYVAIKLTGTATAVNSDSFVIAVPKNIYEYDMSFLVGKIDNDVIKADMKESSYEVLEMSGTLTSDVSLIKGLNGAELEKNYEPNKPIKEYYTFPIEISNAQWSQGFGISGSEDVSSWFKKADGSDYTVSGVKYTLSDIKSSFSTGKGLIATGTITLTGHPDEPSSESITVVVPSSAIQYNLGSVLLSDGGKNLAYNIIHTPNIVTTDLTVTSFVNEDIVSAEFTLTVAEATFDSTNINQASDGLRSWIRAVDSKGGVQEGLTYSVSSISSDSKQMTVKVEGKSSVSLDDVPFTIEVPYSALTSKYYSLYPISGTLKYSITPRPTATITETTSIYGAINSGNISYTMYIDIEEAIIDYSAINDVSKWFEALPVGLSVTAKEASGANVGRMQFDITGEPTADSSDPIAITIPSSAYSYKNKNISEDNYPKKDIEIDVKGSVYDIKDVSATVVLDGGGEIDAMVGTSVSPYIMTVTLKNAEFDAGIKAKSNVNSWFVSSLKQDDTSLNDNAVTGLIFTVSERVSDNIVKVRIEGSLTDTLKVLPLTTKAMNVVIPSKDVAHNVKTITAKTDNIVYNLYRAISASMERAQIYGFTEHIVPEQTMTLNITTDIPLKLAVGDDVRGFFKNEYYSSAFIPDYLLAKISKIDQTTTGYDVEITVLSEEKTPYSNKYAGEEFNLLLPSSAFEKQFSDVKVVVNGDKKNNEYDIVWYPSATVHKEVSAIGYATLLIKGAVDGNDVSKVGGTTATFYIRLYDTARFSQSLSVGDDVSSWFKKADGTPYVVDGLSYKFFTLRVEDKYLGITISGVPQSASDEEFIIVLPPEAYIYKDSYKFLIDKIPNEPITAEMGGTSKYQIGEKVTATSAVTQGSSTTETIEGATGVPLDDVTVRLALSSGTFDKRDTDTDVSSWFYTDDTYTTPLNVEGLSYTLKSESEEKNTADIVILGTPEYSSSVSYPISNRLYIKVPESAVTDDISAVEHTASASYNIKKSARIYVKEAKHQIRGVANYKVNPGESFTLYIEDENNTVKFNKSIVGENITSWFDELDETELIYGNIISKHQLVFTASSLSKDAKTLTVSVSGSSATLLAEGETLTDGIDITIPSSALVGYEQDFKAENNGLSYYIIPAVLLKLENNETKNYVAIVNGSRVDVEYTFIGDSIYFSTTGGTDVSSWFKSPKSIKEQYNVQGLSYTVKSVKNADTTKGEYQSKIVILVSGIPKAKPASDMVEIHIQVPTSAYTYIDSEFSSFDKKEIANLSIGSYEIYNIVATLDKARDVYGITGVKLIDKVEGKEGTIELPISITDTKFVNVPTNPSDIASWFGGDLTILSGLSASIKTEIGSEGSSTLTIVISGKPTQNGSTAEFTKNLVITIPGKYMDKEGLPNISVNTLVGGVQSRWVMLNHAVISVAANATVAGLSGVSMGAYTSPRTFTLQIEGNSFKTFTGDKNITSWITTPVSGLTFTAKPGKTSTSGGYETLSVSVSGTPSTTSSASVITSISVPTSELTITQTKAAEMDANAKYKATYNITAAPTFSWTISGATYGFYNMSLASYGTNTLRITLTLTNGYWNSNFATVGKVLASSTSSGGYTGPLYFYQVNSYNNLIYDKVDLRGYSLVVDSLQDSVSVGGVTRYRTIVLKLSGTRSNIGSASTHKIYKISRTSLSNGISQPSTGMISTSAGDWFESTNANVTGLTRYLPSSTITMSDHIIKTYAYSTYIIGENKEDGNVAAVGKSIDLSFYSYSSTGIEKNNSNAQYFPGWKSTVSASDFVLKNENDDVYDRDVILIDYVSIKEDDSGQGIVVTLRSVNNRMSNSQDSTYRDERKIYIWAKPSAFIVNPGSSQIKLRYGYDNGTEYYIKGYQSRL